MSADAVMETALFFRTPWMILTTTPTFLWLEVLVFWGGRNLEGFAWFALGMIGTAMAWSLQGWEPWNMALNQVMRGRAMRPEEYSPIQVVTTQFFKTPRLKRLQATIIAAGLPIPWLIAGLSYLFDGHPLRQRLPWWAMIMLGVCEAIRGRVIALYVLASRLERNWPALLETANAAA